MSEETTQPEASEAVGEVERLARVYAESLLTVAEKQSQTDDIASDFDGFIDEVLAKNPSIEAFLGGSAATRQEKSQLLERALGGKIDPLLLDFLLVVNRHGRLEYLRPMRAAYRALCDEKAKRERIKVRTATPLDDGQRDRLSSLLREKLGREPVLETHVDPELLGGMVVQIRDEVFDGTVASRLTGLQKQLMARSSNAIQHGRDRFRSDG